MSRVNVEHEDHLLLIVWRSPPPPPPPPPPLASGAAVDQAVFLTPLWQHCFAGCAIFGGWSPSSWSPSHRLGANIINLGPIQRRLASLPRPPLSGPRFS